MFRACAWAKTEIQGRTHSIDEEASHDGSEPSPRSTLPLSRLYVHRPGRSVVSPVFLPIHLLKISSNQR